jgi:hypothetical protein
VTNRLLTLNDYSTFGVFLEGHSVAKSLHGAMATSGLAAKVTDG